MASIPLREPRRFPEVRRGRATLRRYLEVTASRVGIEYVQGRIEVRSPATVTHQSALAKMLFAIDRHLEPKGGFALPLGMCVRTGPHTIRMPDVVAMIRRDDPRAGELVFEGADLVVEVASEAEADRRLDFIDKRKEYAAAGVREYWIVDPSERCITVLALKKNRYVQHSAARPGQDAASALLRGFSVDARAVFERE